jgi:hypothetical protein
MPWRFISKYLLKCRDQTAEYYPEEGSIFFGSQVR